MTANIDELLPRAEDCMKKIALAEAEEAAKEMHLREQAETEKKALLDHLRKPSGVSDEERLKRAAAIIKRAVDRGLTEVEVGRFPNQLCTDRGRAINNNLEPGWEATLTGLPKEMYEFWNRHLRPLGYKIRVQVVDFSEGIPCDIGLTLKLG